MPRSTTPVQINRHHWGAPLSRVQLDLQDRCLDEAGHVSDSSNRHALLAGIEIGLSFVSSPALLIYAGKVIATNPAAARMLASSKVLRLHEGILRTRREKEAQALGALIEEASQQGLHAAHRQTLVLSNRQSQPVMLLSIQSLGRPALGPLAVLRVADLHARTSIDPNALRTQFGLTRGEARVAAALISDRSIAAIAATLNLAPETVRTHLKRLMAKLGVRSQAQMLSLLYEAVAVSSAILPAKPQNPTEHGAAKTLAPRTCGEPGNMSILTWNNQALNFQYQFPTKGISAGYGISQDFIFTADGSEYSGDFDSITFKVINLSQTDEKIIFKTTVGAHWSADPFNGPSIIGPTSDAPISAVTLIGTDIQGISQSNVSFNPNTIWLNWENLTVSPGNTVSLDVHFDVQLTPPTVTITSPSILTNHPNQTISGTVDIADAGSTVFIYDNNAGTPAGQATVDASGNWSAPVTLVEGANILVAKDSNSGGTGTSSSITDTLLTKKPVVTITSSDGLTNNPGPTITGSVGAEGAGDTIRLYQSGVLNDVTTAGADGSWSFSGDGLGADPTFPDGIYNVDITATDKAGNVGSDQISFTLDRTPPTATITSVLPVNGTKLTDLTGLTISGTTSEDGSIALDLFSATGTGPRHVPASATVIGGQWSVTLPAQPDNNYIAIVRATDRAGNQGTDATLGFSITTPQPPIANHGTVTVLQGHNTDITAAIANLVIPGTSGDTETITAASGPGASLSHGHVTFLDPVTTYDAVTGFSTGSNPNGVWSYRAGNTLLGNNTQFAGNWTNGQVLPNMDIIGVNANYLRLDPQLNANATVQFTAQSTGIYTITGDFLGVDPTQHTHKVEILVGDTSVYSDTIASHGQTDTFSLTEVLTAGETIRFISDTGAGGDYTHLATGLQATITTPTTPGGRAEIGYTVTDENGATASNTVTVLTVPPAPTAPVITQVNAAGFAQTGLLTITGSAIAGSTVSIYDGASVIGTAQADIGTGAYSLTLTTPLAGGAHAVAAVDIANGQASAASAATTITVAPPPVAASGTLTIAPGQSTDITAAIKKLVTPGTTGDTETITAISGTGASIANGQVTFSAPVRTFNTATDFSTTTNPNGVWSYLSGNTVLTDNTRYPGYWTNGGTQPNWVGISAPGVWVPNYLRLDPQLNTNASVQFTAPTAGTYTITGDFLGIDPAPHAHQVEIQVGGTSVFTNSIATANQSDAFSLTETLTAGETVRFINDTGPGGDYSHLSTGLLATITTPVTQPSSATIDYTVTDEHGASASGTLTVNIQAPTPPNAPTGLRLATTSDSGVLGDNVTNIAKPTIIGLADAGTTISVYDGTHLLGTTTADGTTGAWSFAAPDKLSDGTHTITATATNAAGGVSQPSAIAGATQSLVIPGTANLYNYNGYNGDGSLALTAALPAGTSRILTFSNVTGAVAHGFNFPFLPPDGIDPTSAIGSNITGQNGIAGFKAPNHGMLLGLFLDGHEQDAGHVTPPALDFNTIGETFTTISPGLDQPFFIGDGLTGNGTGAQQQFIVPDMAKTLVLAQLDGYDYTGPATLFGDNSGAFTVDLSVQTPGLTITIDTTAPVVTETLAHDTGASATDRVTSDATLTGSADANATVTLTEGSSILGITTAGDTGSWSFTPVGLSLGAHTIIAGETDVAGNTGTASLTFNLAAARHAATQVNLSGYNNTVDSPVTATLSNGLSGPAITGPIFGNAATNGTPASETITATGLNNTITAGGGDDTIFAGLGQAHVTVSDTDGDNTVTGSVGFTTVTLGNGDNTITLGGTGNTIKVGTGHNTIDAGIGSETIEIAGGSASVHAQGYYNVFNLNGGAIEITGLTGFATINLGATFTGTNSVDLRGLAGDNFTFANGVGKLTKPDGELIATINAPTDQTLSAIDDGTDGLKIVLGTITPPPPPPAPALTEITETQWGVNITLADATKTVHLAGYNNTVTAASGNHTIDGDHGGLTLTLGSGDNQITVTGTGDTISLGVENGAFTGTGNNTVTGTLGNTTIHTGAGNQTITAAGYTNTIITGAGDSVIDAGAGYSTVNAGDGHNTITAAGNQNTVTTHNGDSTVTLNGWTNLIQAGAGHTLVSGGYFNTYEVTALGTKGGVEVKDFSTQYGDVLNLHDVFTLGDIVKVADGLSNNLLVSIQHGTTTTQVADLHGLAGHSVADLIASHSLIT
eukprot:gene1958-1992_t